MGDTMRCISFCAAYVTIGILAAQVDLARAQTSNELRPPSTFEGISDPDARSRAIFSEIGKVLTHPRCINCHPAGDRPTKGNDMQPHQPPAWRMAGTCLSCHTDTNYTLHERATYRSIPGHTRWFLAPIEMAWQGQTITQICEQLKDPQRNGGRNLELLHDHLAHDDLVAWGWQPGEGRNPAPGSQEQLGELVRAWINTGAACP
jgi:hypothetical protein